MQGGSFQRYVWVQGERKRQRNRTKYEETRMRYLESETDEIESPKKAKVVWPGEFEDQLRKRARKLEKKEQLDGLDTPAVCTPSDTQSLISEVSELEPEPEPIEKNEKDEPNRPEKVKERIEEGRGAIWEDHTHYSDEFLDPPRKVTRVMNEFHSYYPPGPSPHLPMLPHCGPTTTGSNERVGWDYTVPHISQSHADYSDSSMTHGSNQHTPQMYHHNQHMDDADMMMGEGDYEQYQYPEEDEMVDGMLTPRAVHQCNVCNKIFVSYKGLQQHAVIHTDQKPFRCDICSKSFRFKSNLFEHRSVHTGFTPHACPYCGKTCRLKGNLKKHLRTHVTTKEELEAAWRPFASNRRPPADIPDDAIIVRGAGGPYYTPPPRPKKKKLGLGDPVEWLDRVRRGEILHQVDLEDKIRRLEDTIFNNLTLERWNNLFDMAKSIAFETHDCPTCKVVFMTRMDCATHHSIEHESQGSEFFCEKCFRPFADEASFQQHMSYHLRVNEMFDTGALNRSEPDILIPTNEEFHMMFDGNMSHALDQGMDQSMDQNSGLAC